ncbi:MAG TPA: metalloregulator ArsR/SmtB family transcription factor [Phenylobacterium sp.]
MAGEGDSDVVRVLNALGDATRRAIVERLSERPHSVSRLAEPLGVTLTAIGQHLAVLEQAGLVRTEKLGRVRTASLDTRGLAVLDRWIHERRSGLERSLDRLGDLLADDDDQPA